LQTGYETSNLGAKVANVEKKPQSFLVEKKLKLDVGLGNLTVAYKCMQTKVNIPVYKSTGMFWCAYVHYVNRT
jgi:hypothetical protein